MTKDGHIIVCHDEDFERVCKNAKEGQTVINTRFDELPEFADEIPICFSDGSIKYKRKDNDQKCFTKLEDIFKTIPKE